MAVVTVVEMVSDRGEEVKGDAAKRGEMGGEIIGAVVMSMSVEEGEDIEEEGGRDKGSVMIESLMSLDGAGAEGVDETKER